MRERKKRRSFNMFSTQHQHKEGGGVGWRLLPLGVLMARLNLAS